MVYQQSRRSGDGNVNHGHSRIDSWTERRSARTAPTTRPPGRVKSQLPLRQALSKVPPSSRPRRELFTALDAPCPWSSIAHVILSISQCVQHVKAKLRMPAQRPRAAFEPIAPDFDINGLIESTPNFSFVDRISVDQIDEKGVAAFEKLVLLHVIAGGKPLVVDGFENRLDPWTFSSKWLNDNVGSKSTSCRCLPYCPDGFQLTRVTVEQSKNLSTKESLPLTIGHYLRNMNKLSNQFFENARNYKDKSRQRIYLKDIDCPQVWHDKLQDHIPP